MSELGLAERLRVAAALNPNGFTFSISREAALDLVRILEQRKRVADADKWVDALIVDRRTWMDKQIRLLMQGYWNCLSVAAVTLMWSWYLAGWLR